MSCVCPGQSADCDGERAGRSLAAGGNTGGRRKVRAP